MKSFIVAIVVATFGMFSGDLRAVDVYVGMPLSEALYNLSGAIIISHELSNGTASERTDVFKLRDSRLLALTSTSKKIGSTFTISEIRITDAHHRELTKKTKPISELREGRVEK